MRKRNKRLELIPCPLCGGNASILQDITGKKKFHACCNSWGAKYKCPLYAGVTPWSDTPEEAADAWNAQRKQVLT